jgi:hypothetical protein
MMARGIVMMRDAMLLIAQEWSLQEAKDTGIWDQRAPTVGRVRKSWHRSTEPPRGTDRE